MPVNFLNNVVLPDNAKLAFGAWDGTNADLEIYHDGSHSRIVDAGTGHLVINATDFVVNNSADTTNMIINISLSGWDSNTIRRFSDAKKFTQTNNTYVNDYDLFQGLSNQGQTYHAPTKSWTTDLSKTGDYKIGTTAPGTPTEYSFTGDKSFNNPVAKKFKYKDKLSKAKKASYKWVKDSLLKPIEWAKPTDYEWEATQGAEFAGSIGASLSATDIKGATGSSDYANVFGTAAWEKLKSYHKHMNYQGST